MKQVVVGMSGGVDSTVAAFRLKDSGYEVHGVMLRLWKAGDAFTHSQEEHESSAMEAARQLGIRFEILDVRQQFRDRVVAYFIRGYEQGITPNPCFFCNRMLKFDFLQQYADQHQLDWISSGHYARVERSNGEVHLYRGVDPKKDQSYMLSSLRIEQLSRLVLPLGTMTKTEVRQIAQEQGFQAAASKESQDVCFLPVGDYRAFLEQQNADINHPGEIVNRDGQVIGQHHGLAFYTIGQRKGLGIYAPEPTYVLEKDLEQNRLIVGKRKELGKRSMLVEGVYWHQKPESNPFTCSVEIRYHSRPAEGLVTFLAHDNVQVDFAKPLRDITPGQAAVFYNGDEVIGSGMIAVERKAKM